MAVLIKEIWQKDGAEPAGEHLVYKDYSEGGPTRNEGKRGERGDTEAVDRGGRQGRDGAAIHALLVGYGGRRAAGDGRAWQLPVGEGECVADYVKAMRIGIPGWPRDGYTRIRTLDMNTRRSHAEVNAVKVSVGVLGVISQAQLLSGLYLFMCLCVYV